MHRAGSSPHPPNALTRSHHRTPTPATTAVQYEFDPKKLLGTILSIFVHIFAADREHRFALAIAEDARSYRPQNFTEASAIAADRGLPSFTPAMAIALDDLADAVQQATVLRVREDDEVCRRPAHSTAPCLPFPPFPLLESRLCFEQVGVKAMP